LNGVDFLTVLIYTRWREQGLLVFNLAVLVAIGFAAWTRRTERSLRSDMLPLLLLESTIYALSLGTVINLVLGHLPLGPPGGRMGPLVALVASHLTPSHYFKNRDNVGDGAFRRLARRLEPELLYLVSRADCLGRTGDFATDAQEWFIGKVRALGVEEKPPRPILMGRHLLEMGLAPGPEIGRVTRAVFEMQLDGRVSDLEAARRAARDLLRL
jgi:hypothetical protein